MISDIRDNYSSNVELCLITNGRRAPLAKIGPDFVILSEPSELSGGRAVVHMSVDGECREWPVTIEDVVPFEDRVRIHDVG